MANQLTGFGRGGLRVFCKKRRDTCNGLTGRPAGNALEEKGRGPLMKTLTLDDAPGTAVLERPVVAQSRAFRYTRRLAHNALVLLFSDAIALLVAFSGAGLLRDFLFDIPMYSLWSLWVVGCWWAGAALAGLAPGWGLSPVEALRRQVTLTCAVFAGTAVALFLSKTGDLTSRFTTFVAFLLAVPLIPFLRIQAKVWLIRHGKWGIPVAVYGGGETGRAVVERLREEPGQGYYPVCVFDDNPLLRDQEVEGLPVIGSTTAATLTASVAIVAMPSLRSAQVAELLEGVLTRYRRVLVIPDLIEAPSLWVSSRDLSGMPGLEITQKLLDPGRRFLKRAFDMTVILATTPLWGPLCGLIALLIWLEDRRTPLFLQDRLGLDGSVFKTWKFRTMTPGAEESLRQRCETDEEFKSEWETGCKLENDPRITRVGRFLRKTSLDEIPQLINVLKGEMSLVGPRPLPQYHYDQLPLKVRQLRERVRPGMTGMWQVSGRSAAGNVGMVRWDPYYVRNWSLWLDIVILVRTVRVVIRGSGAY